MGEVSGNGLKLHIREGGFDVVSRLHGLLDHRIYLRQLKEHICAVLLRTPEDLVAGLQAVVKKADANMLWRVRENAVRRTAFSLIRCRELRTLIVNYRAPSLGQLLVCAVLR
jgi:hypothetical protein